MKNWKIAIVFLILTAVIENIYSSLALETATAMSTGWIPKL
jgi:hypothetical protein